jgi:prepilin-type N-terminal cleavage/methylation domain-containing protein/prepilin-type processing-associated H-X9-DG protein
MRTIQARRRAGFTLIELLVVIAIIGTLVGLLLPAVQKVRESANRSQCANNLKQQVLALHAYSESHKNLPASTNIGPTAPRVNWVTLALPYIDQQHLFQKYDFTVDWFNAANLPITQTPLKVMQCPSAAPANRLDGKPEGAPAGTEPWLTPSVSAGDYGATTHVGARLATAGYVDNAGPGVMPKNSTPRLSDVTDGLTNTIIIAESAGRPQIWRNGVAFGTPGNERVNGGGWCRAASDFSIEGFTADGSTSPGPFGINVTNGENWTVYPDPYYGRNGTSAIYAFHPDGANVALADGSVQFLRSKLDIRVLGRLVTRGGGESIGASDF